MAEQRQYDEEYKVQAIKLADKIGQTKAAEELGIPKNTLYGWVRKARLGYIDLGKGTQTPESAMSLVEELNALRKRTRSLKKQTSACRKKKRYWQRRLLFSQRTVGSREKRKNEIHRQQD